MSNKNSKIYTVNFGSAVTVFPSSAIAKILSGEATATDTAVLAALLSINDPAQRSSTFVAAMTGLSEDACDTALAFWRGAGVLNVSEAGEEVVVAAIAPAPSEKAEKEAQNAPAEKKILSCELPKYSGQQISALLDKDGGKLKNMIDVCQQLIGHIFNPNETNTMVGLCDWLGLDEEYVITLCSYYTAKKPGCNVRYIERAAVDLVNNGTETPEQLDNYLRDMELYDGLAGKLRSWLGIGTRAYTKKENGMIKRWVKDFGYGEDVVRLAYEITVDAKGSFNFDYAGKILENWFTSGVNTAQDAETKIAEFRQGKEEAKQSGGSFDTDEFFDLALKRSYKNLGTKK
jgi:DnaD/phage-associated family protein